MTECDGCSATQTKNDIHKTHDGQDCCITCAMYCSKCDKWFYPDDIRECNGDFLCTNCVKKEMQI